MRLRSSNPDRIVANYLRRLDHALRGVPSSQRREIGDEVRNHILAARTELDLYAGEAAVRTVLEHLGTPDDIARAAYADRPARSKAGLVEVAAVILLPLGGLLVIVGWMIGLVFLWASPMWTLRDKLIGTLLPPGGLLAPMILIAVGPASTYVSVCQVNAGSISTNCRTSGGSSGASSVYGVVALCLLTLPFLTAGYLAWCLRRPDVLAAQGA